MCARFSSARCRPISQATNGTATFNHDYDTAGRLIKVTRPDGKVVEYTADTAGNRTSLEYPGTPTYTVNYAYDELGRPKDVKENGTTTLAAWAYPDRLNATVTYATTTTRTVQGTLANELAKLTNTLNGEVPVSDSRARSPVLQIPPHQPKFPRWSDPTREMEDLPPFPAFPSFLLVIFPVRSCAFQQHTNQPLVISIGRTAGWPLT